MLATLLACGEAPAPEQEPGELGTSQAALVNDSAITVTAANAAQKRQDLVSYIWGTSGFPSTKLPVMNHITSPVAGLPNLSRVDSLTVTMNDDPPFQESNVTFHYIPTRKNNRLVILSMGHQSCVALPIPPDPLGDIGDGMTETLATLLNEGFSVLTTFMPHVQAGQCGDVSHDAMIARTLASNHGHALKWFMEPIAVSLNYLKSRSAADNFPVYQDFSMTGLSGGGWTTVVYAAIDPSIAVSIPVSGSVPIYLRAGSSVGDAEQTDDAFFSRFGYPDLYVLGGWGKDRHQVWVLNRRDTCCFGESPGEYDASAHGPWDAAMRTVEGQVRNRLFDMSSGGVGAGYFRLEIDEAATQHQISWNSILNVIVPELTHGRRMMGASSPTSAFVRGLNGHLWWNNNGGWSDTGLPMVGVPAAIAGANHTQDVVYRGPANQMMLAFPVGSTWQSQAITGASVTDPVVVNVGTTIFAVGMGGIDRHPYLWKIASSGAVTVRQLSGTVQFVGQPALVAASDGLHLYGVGLNRQLYHLKSDSLSDPINWAVDIVGGQVSDFPSATRLGTANRVYVRDLATNHVMQAMQSGTGAWAWSDLTTFVGSTVLHNGSPSVSLNGSEIDVYSRATNGFLERFKRDSAGNWSIQDVSTNLSGAPHSVGGQAFVRGTSGQLWNFNGSAFTALGGLFY